MNVVALVCREVVAIGIPDFTICKETGVVCLGIVDYRVTLHIVIRTVHLDTLDADYLVIINIVVATNRLHNIVIVHQHATAFVATNLIGGIEAEVVSIEQRIAINDLDDRSKNLGYIIVAIV